MDNKKRDDLNRALKALVYLASCAVDGIKPDPERMKDVDLGVLYETAERYFMCGITAMALESAGIKTPEFTKAKGKAVCFTAAFDIERAAITELMEKEGIWYMPLKGAVIKSFYPKMGMRQMADNDILFDASRAEDVKKIMESRGYKTKEFGKGVHDVYHKLPIYNFEMHRTLFGEKFLEQMDSYYEDFDRLLLSDESGYGRHLSDNDLYLYVIAHEYKHYMYSGTGIRSLLDTYVILKKTGDKLDFSYIEREAEKIGMAEFEKINRSLSMHLFSGEELTEDERKMFDEFISCGVYGRYDRQIQSSVQKKIKERGSGKLGYMLYRFSVPFCKKNERYEDFASQYPFFYRHRILLPLLPFYRILRAIAGRRFSLEAKAIVKAKTKKD